MYFVHPSTDVSVDISVECRSICRSTYRSSVGRYVGRHIGRHSADMSTEICRSTYRPTYTAISIYVVGSKLQTYATRPNGSMGRKGCCTCRILMRCNVFEGFFFLSFFLFSTRESKLFKPQ